MKTITIILSEENKTEWDNLRCIQCGRLLCNVNRAVESVLLDNKAGEVLINNLDRPMVEVKCRGCNCMYNILIQ